MRRLNLKLLLIVFAILAVLGTGTYFLNRWQIERSAGRLGTLAAETFTAAEKAKAADKPALYRQSAELYSRYLRYYPNDIDTLASYGRLLADTGSPAQALVVLSRVQGSPKYVNDPEILRRLVKVSLATNRFSEAERLLDDMLSESNPNYSLWSTDAEIYRSRAICRDDRSDTELAIADYRRATELDPLDPIAPARLAQLLRTQGQGEEADKILDRMIRQQEEAEPPTDPEALAKFNENRSQAYYLRAAARVEAAPRTRQGQIPEAMATAATADALRAAELEPSSILPLMLITEITSKRERPDWNLIRRLLEPVLDTFAEEPSIYLALAEAYTKTQRVEEAISILERGRRATDNADIAFGLATLYIAQENIDVPSDASGNDRRSAPQRLIDDLQRRSYDKGRVALLEARLIMADRDRNANPIGDQRWGQAAQLLRNDVLGLLRPDDSMMTEARRLLITCIESDPTLPDEEKIVQKNQVMQQIALEGNQQASDTLLRMAATLEALGRYSEAVQTYASIPAPSPETVLARTRAQILATLEKPPAERDWDSVEASLAQLEKVSPDNPQVPVLRAEMLISRNEFDQTQAVLDAARQAHPEHIEIWAAAVALADRRNQPQVVEQLIQAAEAQTTDPDRPLTDKVGVMLLRSRQLGALGGADSISRLDSLAAQVDSVTAPDDRRRLLRGLVEAYLNCGEPKRALALWKKDLEGSTNTDSLIYQTVTFDLALAAGDQTAQDQAIARLKSPSIEGETGIYWRLALARQNIARVEALPASERQNPTAVSLLNEARDLLNEVARQRANNPQVAIALGKVADLQGQAEEAANHYYTAFRLGARDLSVLQRTVTLLTDTQRYAQARAVLDSILRRTTMTPELERVASQIAFYDRDYNRAITQAQTVVDKGSKNPLDYTWLAQLLLATGRRPEAEAMLQRAIELDPSRAEGHLMWIEFLASTGRMVEASAAAAAAEKALATTNPLGLAQCFEMAGRDRDADALYRKLIDAPPDMALDPAKLASADDALLRNYATFLSRRGRRNDAVAVFEAILKQSTSTARADDRLWASSLLALVKARDTDSKVAGEAITGVGLPLDPRADLSEMAATGTPVEIRVKARVLAVQRDPNRRRQAIQLLEKLHERRAADANDLLLLARLHETSKDWNRAQINYRNAIEANRANLSPLIAYIQALLRRKEPADQIFPWIEQFEKTRGESPLSTQFRALVFKNEKNDDKAIELLTSFASKHPEQTVNTSRILEFMGYDQAAENLLRPYVEKMRETQPQIGLVLAEFLGRHNRVKEALDLCEPLWKTLNNPSLVAATSVNILLGNQDLEQARRVERWLQQAINQNRGDVQLETTRGVLLFIMNRSDEAEALYRKLLEEDPSNPVVLNNLAWLLSFQENKADEALELVNRAIDRVGSNEPSLLDTRAVIQIARRDANSAIHDLEMAISQKAEPGMYFHLARAQLMAGQDEAARRSWEEGHLMGLKAETLGPLERPIYDELQARIGKATNTPTSSAGNP